MTKYLIFILILFSSICYGQTVQTISGDGIGTSYKTFTDSLDVIFSFMAKKGKPQKRSYNQGFTQLLLAVKKDTLRWVGDSLLSIYFKPLYYHPVSKELKECENKSIIGTVVNGYNTCAWDTLFQGKYWLTADYDSSKFQVDIPADLPPCDGAVFRFESDSLKFVPLLKQRAAKW